MDRTSIAPWLFVLCLCSDGAHAQGKGILGRDNSQFARKLFEARLPDLAESVCRTIEQNGGSAVEVLEVKALQFELHLDQAQRLPDLAARKQGLLQVLADENAFIKENARTSVADLVRANLPRVYLELGTVLTASLLREQDLARRAELTQEGQKIFEDGKNTLRERVERFQKQLADGTGNLEYAERQHLIAAFNLAQMDYQHAQLFAEGSPERKQLIESALQRFKDVGFDYPDKYESYMGTIYQGLCHEYLGQFDDAVSDYADAIALREQFELDTKGVYQVGPQEADIISGATLNRVKLLTRLKRTREAIEAADDFLRTIPDALQASSGPEVLAAQAEAEIAAGDIAGASATAEALVNSDPQGWGGRRGRELLAQLPVFGLAPDKLMKIAETTAMRGDFSRALDLCRWAREAVRGARDEQEIGAAAFFLAGRFYAMQGRLHEASAAYDCAAEYQKGSKAPDALDAAVDAYRGLAKLDRSRFYFKRADERMTMLATRYPQHPKAARAGIWQGQKLEEEDDFAGAIEFYSKIAPGSQSYEEASFRLANATYQQAKTLQQQKKPEAAPLLQQAEEQYKKSIDLLTKAQEATLDTAVQQRLGNFVFSAKLGLGSLLIDVQRPAQVQPLIAGLEDKVNGDPDMVAAVWSLRIRALQAEGKVDQAVALFESLLKSSPDAPGIASAAGFLARAVDQAALTLSEKEPRSKRVDELWQRAAFYYSLSVKAALDGASALRGDDVSQVAQRLYTIGLYFNQVPEGQSTFVDWQGTVQVPDLWERAAGIYEKLDAQAPSYKISIERARTLAILGRIPEAEALYARLFDQVSLIVPGGNQFDRAAIEARPELVSAYLEWGVTEHLVGLDAKDQGRLDRAAEIYNRMLANTSENSRLWWQAKYFLIKLLSDRGDYVNAAMAIKNVTRTVDAQFDKGQFGFQEKFQALEKELSKKVK